ncbi:similar to Saccharomyces cerevisiae YOL002C IZH2 Plasma membrane protein involved in zinc homeostasis and osmotin-induced apoptosis [Maudiozyma barnettii]|uniref:Similar to Saccharomyces cerevisiae YOL002C IZH2 Plasma membrane protein involved in zinc homeostasis and osmotin-induced apoptosis n=1 Tax=Maudiozyma barnettii TaxID=61262 RepID=A0A8H2VH45_9SACH|nr:PAQR-type receptor [Kazachstania barnettii]CAB4255559.1 similar to Saccharomyces cerevisiae YOL002C IZH2 Plasma membrane protein involved in zinc homeostasis and osmotin-induced apoptosis [Kazachstania barnettii]CAD1784057.1 similar to Saccharomyces cerevisiae YOL002C IZH2 Plasma membrane protein involved in zinc homeostasis and osmotin-induced apoptosis [Kazachstania barnettii]
MTANIQKRTANKNVHNRQISENGQIKAKVTHTTKHKLYTWHEIPDWQKDNEFIHGGYVRETNSFTECINSLFYLHNESVNIYSHLIPGLIALLLILIDKYYVPKFNTTTMTDYFFIDLFFFGAFTCLTMSSIFHCLKSHSPPVAKFGNKLDYLGIVILISTSMVSILYYGFYDSSYMFYTFSGITLLFGFACAVVSLDERFRSREWRPYRAAMFVLFGLSAFLPIGAGLVYYGSHETWTRVQLKWIILEGVLYILGASLYGGRFPEKIKPGRYDMWGHSHQIFHILVVVAALCHFTGLIKSYTYVHTYMIPVMIQA